MRLSKELIRRMAGGNSRNYVSGGSSGGSGGGGVGYAEYAAEAGHAQTADKATHATSAADIDSNSAVYNRFLRKDQSDDASGEIGFLSGLKIGAQKLWWVLSTGAAKFLSLNINGSWGISSNGTATLGSVSATGVTSSGDIHTDGSLDVDGNANIGGHTQGVTADFTDVTVDNLGTQNNRVQKIWATNLDVANAVAENLQITNSAYFTKLIVDEMLSNKGAIIATSANCVAEKVVRDGLTFKVYFSKTDRDGNNVDNPWIVGDLALCLTFKGEGAGTFANVSNRYYWRRVTGITSDDAGYHMIRLSNNSGDYDGTTVPAAGDNIVQLGYNGSASGMEYRQSAVILSAYPTMDAGVTPPSLAFYKGINDFSLSSHRYTYIDGLNNEFIGNFKILVNGSYTNLTTVLATLEGIVQTVQTNVLGVAKEMSQIKQTASSISLGVSYDDHVTKNLLGDSAFKQSGTSYDQWYTKNGMAEFYNEISNQFTAQPLNSNSSATINVLRQYIYYATQSVAKIEAGKLYRLSFYVRSSGVVRLDSPVSTSSTSYTSLRTVRMVAGMTYRFMVTGYTTRGDCDVLIRIYHNSTYTNVATITGYDEKTVEFSFTAAASGTAVIEFASSLSGQTVSVSKLLVDASVVGLWMSGSFFDSSAGMLIDGTETTAVANLYFHATEQWTRHSIVFKAHSTPNLASIYWRLFYNSPAFSIYNPCLEEELTDGLKRTGIDIEQGKITVKADDFVVTDTSGSPLMQASTTGGIKMIETEVQGSLDVVCTNPAQGFTATASIKQHAWGAGVDITTTDGNGTSYAHIGTRAGDSLAAIDCYSNYGSSPASVHIDPSGVKVTDGSSALELNHQQLSIGDTIFEEQHLDFGTPYLALWRDGVEYPWQDSLGGTGRTRLSGHYYIQVSSTMYILVVGGFVVGSSTSRPGSGWTTLPVNPDIW